MFFMYRQKEFYYDKYSSFFERAEAQHAREPATESSQSAEAG
jgi:hypothetical protein